MTYIIKHGSMLVDKFSLILYAIIIMGVINEVFFVLTKSDSSINSYQYIAIPTAMLIFIALCRHIKKFNKDIHSAIQNKWVIDSIIIVACAGFLFQVSSVIMTGTTLYPTFWWGVHGSFALAANMLANHK